MKNLVKRIFIMILSMAVFFTAIPTYPVFAEDTTAIPKISIGQYTTVAGNYAYVDVYAEDFNLLTAMECTIYYDAEVFSLDWWNTEYMLYSSTVDINTLTEGEIKCSVANIDGISGSGYLFSFGFEVHADAKEGTYPLTLAIGEAYDMELNPVSIRKQAGSIEVQKPSETTEQIYFWSYCDKDTVQKGESFVYQLYCTDSRSLAAGNFIFEYDKDMLELTNVGLGGELKSETAIFAVNQETDGYVKISYADMEAITEYYETDFFSLTFQAKADVSAETQISFSADSLISETLGTLWAENNQHAIYIEKLPQEITYPILKVECDETISEEGSFTANVVLGADANVAAGDFTISYNRNHLICTGVTASQAVTDKGGYIVAKEKTDDGEVIFSYINLSPFQTEESIATLTFQCVTGYSGNTSIQCSGKDVVNAQYEDVTLEYQAATIMIPKKSIEDYSIKLSETSYVYDGTAKEPKVTIEGLEEGKDYTVTYRNNIQAGTATVVITGCGNYTGVVEKTFEITEQEKPDTGDTNKPDSGNNNSQKPQTKTYTVTFNKCGGKKLTTSKKKVTAGKTYGTLPTVGKKGYIFKGWYTAKKGGKKVTAKTKVATNKNHTLYAQWTKVKVPSKCKISSIKNVKGKKATVKWKKVNGAKGYQVVYATNSKMKSSKKVTTTSISKTLTKLKKGKTYYVKVRAYKYDSLKNKVYGSYSAVKKVKITK